MKPLTNVEPARPPARDRARRRRAPRRPRRRLCRRRQRPARHDQGSARHARRRGPAGDDQESRSGDAGRRRPDDRRVDDARRDQPASSTSASGTRCWPRRPKRVATPQIRNVGTLAGNVCQRPWCWYYRNGFPCYKAGGNHCFSFAGENQFHAIFGGGPSYIVHPSDTAPALVALDADVPHRRTGGRADGAGRRLLRAAAPRSRARERPGGRRGARVGRVAGAARGHAQHLSQGHGPRSVDARRRQRRDRARDGTGRLPRARGSCSAASRRFRGGCPRSRSCWPGSASRRSWPRAPARPRWPARVRWRRTPTRCRWRRRSSSGRCCESVSR